MPRVKSHGPLAYYAQHFPYRDLFVSLELTESVVVCMKTGTKIAYYTRARDARRQLRKLGYTIEGKVWRIVPKKEQPVVPVAIEHVLSEH